MLSFFLKFCLKNSLLFSNVINYSIISHPIKTDYYIGKLILDLNKKQLDLDMFLNTKISSKSIQEIVDEMIAKIGENIVISDLKIFDKKNNYLSFYVHNAYRKNIGKIISILKYSSEPNDESIKNFAKNLCMHIAALKPEAIDEDNLEQTIIDKELNIQKELIASSGKPANVIDKILEGKMKKFYSEVTLLNQSFVLDPDKSVKEVINSNHKDQKFAIDMFYYLSLT